MSDLGSDVRPVAARNCLVAGMQIGCRQASSFGPPATCRANRFWCACIARLYPRAPAFIEPDNPCGLVVGVAMKGPPGSSGFLRSWPKLLPGVARRVFTPPTHERSASLTVSLSGRQHAGLRFSVTRRYRNSRPWPSPMMRGQGDPDSFLRVRVDACLWLLAPWVR